MDKYFYVTYVYRINLHQWILANLAKWLSVWLRTVWLWVWIPLPHLVQFPRAIGKDYLFMEGRHSMSTLNFGIFLEFPHFLRLEVLGWSATHETLVDSVFGGNNLVPFHLCWKETSQNVERSHNSCDGLSGKFSSASYFFKNAWKLFRCACHGRNT